MVSLARMPGGRRDSLSDEDLTGDSLRILVALCDVARRERPGTVLPLRRIANWTLEGDTDQAAAILASLDLSGYIRTDTMGWHAGWVTDKGMRAVPEPDESPDDLAGP
jgi:hypothetical protein